MAFKIIKNLMLCLKMLAKITNLKKKLEQSKSKEDLLANTKELELLLKNIKGPENEKYKKIVNEKLFTCYMSLSNATNSLESINYLYKALEFNDTKHSALVYNNLAHKYLTDGNDYKKAEECYIKCIEKDPSINIAYHGIIQIYKQTADRTNEMKYIELGIKNCPKDGEFYNFKGVSLFEEDLIAESIKAFKKGISVTNDPKVSSKMEMNLGHVQSSVGLCDDSIVSYVKSLKTDPEHILSYENILLNINYFKNVPDVLMKHKYVKTFGHRNTMFYKGLNNHPEYHKFISGVLYDPENEISSEKTVIYKNQKIPTNRIIKIGYVSGDLVGHAVSIFTGPIFKNYNSAKFKIYVYSTKYYDKNAIDNIGHDLNYRHIQNLSIDNCLELVYKDNIDILIDLSGYTNGNKLDLFGKIGHEIAMYHGQIGPKGSVKVPIIVSYLGYPANTGIKHMYRVTDVFTETGNEYPEDPDLLIKLPRLFLCFSSLVNNINITKKGINGFENHIVLGSYAKLQKINKDVIDTWIVILDRFKAIGVPCVFILKNKYFADVSTRETWTNKFGNRSDVLLINGTKGYHEHFDLFNLLDIQLDTWPYSGTTITCESLFMNVPVITYCDRKANHVSKVSASILNAMSLENAQYAEIYKDFICYSKEDYVDKVLKYYKVGRDRTLPVHKTFLSVMNPERYMKEYEDTLLNFFKE